MSLFKEFLKLWRWILPFRIEPKIHRWLIFFDGDVVGVYWGEDLSHLFLDEWIDGFPGNPEPIMLAEFFDLY